MQHEDCTFCKISNKKLPTNTILEDSAHIAFLDANPFSKGHVIVIPKLHYETTNDMPKNELADLFQFVQKITTAMMDGITPESYSWIVLNDEIDHAHVHIVPRKLEDGVIKFKKAIYTNYKEMDKLTEKIKNNL